MQNESSPKKRGLWASWRRLSASPEPSPDASLEKHEVYRHTRLASIIILVMFGAIIISIPSAFVGQSYLFFILGTECILNVIAMAFNRRGNWQVSGLIISFTYTGAVWGFLLSTPGGLNPSVLPALVLLVMPEILVAALLPSWCVFVDATINSLFAFLAITYMPHTAAFEAMLSGAYAYGAIGTTIVQFLVASVTFLWSRSTQQAIYRADRAQEIVRLQRYLTERDRAQAVQKQQLEASIQQIEMALEQIANGNLSVRVPLTPENTLWSIAGKLNNLLNRFYRMIGAEQRLQMLSVEIARLTDAVRFAKAGNYVVRTAFKGTPVDQLILELNENYVQSKDGAMQVSNPPSQLPATPAPIPSPFTKPLGQPSATPPPIPSPISGEYRFRVRRGDSIVYE